MNLELQCSQKCIIDVEERVLRKAALLYPFDGQVVVITDTNIPEQLVSDVTEQYKTTHVFKIQPSEKSKNMQTVLEIIDFLLEKNITKNDLLFALGGGVCLDIVGFVASIYKRGIKYISAPTSTMSQIDSCLGGKTGVNYKHKNIIGSFNHPERVFVDPLVLHSLPQRHYINGLVEAIKIGVCFDENILSLIYHNYEENIKKIICRCLTIKKDIVEKDEKDENYRKILNYGHTVAHAIEINHPELLHGECVAIGMYLETSSASVRDALLYVYKKIGLLSRIEPYLHKNYQSYMENVCNDKKWNKDSIDLVVVKKLCQCSLEKTNLKKLKEMLSGESHG